MNADCSCRERLHQRWRRMWDSTRGCAMGSWLAASSCVRPDAAGFLFLYFLFLFFTKIYFRFGNLQKYTPAARLPGGRDLAARLPGGRGLSAKKRRQKITDRSLGTGRPAAGRPAPQAARLIPYMKCIQMFISLSSLRYLT